MAFVVNLRMNKELLRLSERCQCSSECKNQKHERVGPQGWKLQSQQPWIGTCNGWREKCLLDNNHLYNRWTRSHWRHGSSTFYMTTFQHEEIACTASEPRVEAVHTGVSHPDAFTLSIDLSGKMTVGKDQGGDRCRYIMVACYTFPVTGDGKPLIDHPGAPKEDKNHPLPSMDLYGGGGRDPQHGQLLPLMDLHGGAIEQLLLVTEDDEVMMDDGGDLPPVPEDPAELEEPKDPLQEQSVPEPGPDGLVEETMRTAFDVWHRLVEDAQNVGVKNLTFTEVIPSRAVKDVLPALAKIYARLRYLVGCHCIAFTVIGLVSSHQHPSVDGLWTEGWSQLWPRDLPTRPMAELRTRWGPWKGQSEHWSVPSCAHWNPGL